MFFTKGINKIGNKIFFGGASLEDFLFVFDDNFIVSDFDDFFTRDGEFGIGERFEGGAFDNNLLNDKIISGHGEVLDVA